MSGDVHGDPPHLRRLACCRSEPPCPLCPLLPGNEGVSLAELARRGLRANLPELGVGRADGLGNGDEGERGQRSR